MTGPLVTVLHRLIDLNAGPGAVAERRWPGLAMAADPGGGPQRTVTAAMGSLLEHVTTHASPANLSVTVRQDGHGLVCTVREARDRTNVEISPRASSLEGFRFESRPPSATAVWAGGEDESGARAWAYQSVVPPPQWPLRLERFEDERTRSAGELVTAAGDALIEGAASMSLEVTPAPELALGYRSEFDLGDLVSVVIDGVASVEVVTSATFRIDGTGVRRSFTTGPDARTGLTGQDSRLDAIDSRLRRIERTT